MSDEQPVIHEIGNRKYLVADVDPLDVDGIRTLQIGTVLWGVAFLMLLPFSGSLQDHGHLWWLWTCAAGLGLGLLGIDSCKRHKRKREAADRG